MLSLEESGKACVIRWKAEGRIKRDITREVRRSHLDKHQIFGAYRMVKAVLTVGKIVKKKSNEERHDDPAFTDRIQKALDENARVPKGVVEIGLLDHFKQDGFYTDLDENLEAVSPTVPYDEQWFKFVADYAREALEMARADPVTHEVTGIIYDAYRPLMMSAKQRRASIKLFVEHVQKYLQR